MARISKGNRVPYFGEYLSVPFLAKTLCVLTLVVVIVNNSSFQTTDYGVYTSSSSYLRTASCDDKFPDVDYHVDETCTKLPTISPSGSYFKNAQIQAGTSPVGFEPAFFVGSLYAEKIKYHMAGDVPMFNFIKKAMKGREGQVAIDFGANQGFFTYYLATLGMEVHSFEINDQNFASLQHGAEFNPKDVTDRVNLYPVGIGNRNARFGLAGQLYEGHLSKTDGPILGATFDCFAHHTKNKLDLSKGVAFVKLDVEGFEIAVLQGAKHSLFREGATIGAMVVEVGPKRWERADVDFETGLASMKDLASHFQNSYVLLRSAEYAKTCPEKELSKMVQGETLETDSGNAKYKVEMGEWRELLKKMEENDYDCNFWYEN